MPTSSAPCHRVALLGFSDFERRTLGSCFRLAGPRGTTYVLTTRVDTADYLVADADHLPSVEVVKVTERVGVCVFIGSHPPEGAMRWLTRPIDPLRVMRELDALVSVAEGAPPTSSDAAVVPTSRRPLGDGGDVDAETDTTPAAFNVGPPTAAAPSPARPSPLRSVPVRAHDRAASAETGLQRRGLPTLQPEVQPAQQPQLPPHWQPETLPGWEPEWPEGWSAAGSSQTARFVPADDASLAPRPNLPSQARVKAPMQAWVDAPDDLRQRVRESMPSPLPPSFSVAEAAVPAGDGRPLLRALVVDDSPVAARFLQQRLEGCGLQVTCTDNSGDALALLDAGAYELVFLDVELGPLSALDGLALCQRIRQSAAAVDTSVVLVSAHHSQVDRARGLLAGCDAYLGKPLQAAELQRLLARHGVRGA